MTNYRQPGNGRDQHEVYMKEMRSLQKQNAEQIAAIAVTHAKFADELQEFVTAVKLMQQEQRTQNEAIAELKRRNEEADRSAAEHRFVLGNNVVYWVLGAAGAAFGAFNFIAFIMQHWK